MSKVMSMRRACAALIACILLAAAAFAVMTPSQAHAVKSDEPYTYTVRVFGGNEGTYDGGNPAEYTVSDGEQFTLDTGKVSVSDDKYYAKGFRVSGEDALCDATTTINEDTDFVVAYGVKGNMVTYTVNFVEYGTGNAVANDAGATSVSFEGKVGDKPIIPAEYVPGYRPRYWNITGTLVDGENNWTLEYIPLTVEEIVETTTTTEGGAAAGAAGGAAAGAEGGAAAGAEGGAAGAAGAAGGAAGGAATTAPPATEQIVDVDNPLASGNDKSGASADKDEKAEQSGPDIPIVPIVGGIAAAVVVVAAVGAFFSRKKK